MRRLLQYLPAVLFGFALVSAGILYGIASFHFKWFPYEQLEQSHLVVQKAMPNNKALFWYYIPSEETEIVKTVKPEKMNPGLTKLVSVNGDASLAISVVDSDGTEVQHWRVEWPNVFPEAPDYLSAEEIPSVAPGTHIHGAEILANGDVVFNFEHLALVRLDPCGNVVWTVPYRTHHSVFIDDDGNIWVSAQRNHAQPLGEFPFIQAPFIEPVILKISPQGEILVEQSVFQLLLDNHQEGALYMTTTENFWPYVQDDTLHLNDVEIFPRTLEPGFFQPGDIMISLRNLNSVMVYDSKWQLKYNYSNEVVRQHDPDFVDGNRFSVFDNHNVAKRGVNGVASRILMHSAVDETTQVVFEGSDELPFFTNVMGKHQWLENGNLLVSESRYGRVLELTPGGEVVWEYINVVDQGWLAIVEEAERLPLTFDREFFAQARDRCTR